MCNAHFRSTIVIEALPVTPILLTAVALIVCVPTFMVLLCNVAEHDVALEQTSIGLLSAAIVIDAMPLGSPADEVMLILPLFLIVAPLFGE
jgi:hypothetical protein